MISIKAAKKKCKDDISKIENYDLAIADMEHMWLCHHRLELTLDGEFAHSKKELIRMNMYFHRPYFELIFLTRSDHSKLHNRFMTKETKTKISEIKKGMKLSEEHKRNISEARKERTYSEFGRKFKEHFGITRSDNQSLYVKEFIWYKRHGKCRWE